MLTKTKVALATVLALAALSPAYAAGGGNNAHQTYLDEQYASSHPVIVPGTPPGISTPATAYGFAPSSPDARSSFSLPPRAARERNTRGAVIRESGQGAWLNPPRG